MVLSGSLGGPCPMHEFVIAHAVMHSDLSTHARQGQLALELPFHDGVLVGADLPGAPTDLLLDVLVELLEGHDPVAVVIGGAAETLEEVVGEEPVTEL